MKLNHPGIYRLIGEKFELLATVIGEVPCLRIVQAIDINHLVLKGEFKVLEEDSIEIQTVLANPDKFVAFEYEYSDVATLPPYRQSIRGTKCPDITDEQFKEFKARYLVDNKYSNRGCIATKAYIVEKTGWTLAQAHVVVLKIVNSLQHEHQSTLHIQ